MSAKRVSVHRVLVTTMLIDAGDLLLLGIASILTGSVLMFVQLLQGVANVTLDSFLLIGLRRSKHRKDARHPFGYGRALYIWAMFSTLIMFTVVSTLAIYIGWRRFLNPEPIGNIALALGILSLSLVTNSYGVYLSTKRLEEGSKSSRWSIRQFVRRYFSSTYVETKAAFITDFAGSLSALVGVAAFILFLFTHNLQFDGLGAITIGVVEALLSFSLLLNIKDLLIGRGASREMNKHIEEAALTVPHVERVVRTIAERVGLERLLINLDIHVASGLTTHQIEQITEDVKEAIRRDVPDAYYVQVEIVREN